MKIAIIDDVPEMCVQLAGYIERYGRENSVTLESVSFPSGDSFLSDYRPDFDLIIFDIDMPGTNGLDTARQVRKMNETVVILFVTNIAQYAINGYEVDAVDYILKPVGYYDFAMKFKRALRKANRNRPERLVLDSTSGKIQVETSAILYVEVLDHYLIYHTKEAAWQVRGSFREHESTLRKHGFSRTHKSYMVNLAHIQNVRASGVILEDKVIPLGRSYKDSLMEDYLRFLHG